MKTVIKHYVFLPAILLIGIFHSGFANSDVKDYKYLLEEEKLARDVYYILEKKWNLQIFYNIESSEQRHMELVKSILISNGITYEVKAETGKFNDSSLQQLYDALIQKGLKSVKDALEVGLSIEDMDIADLEKMIKNTQSQSDIEVLTLLLEASKRHQSAFTRNLNRYK